MDGTPLKRIFIRLLVLAIISTLISCVAAPPAAPVPLRVSPSAVQSLTPKTTPLTTPGSPDSFPTSTPYPTAQAVKAEAVAFIAGDWQNHSLDSLWVANEDGSGEKELIGAINDSQLRPYSLKWSTNGKWISYISGDDLWLVSPDGSVNRKILSPSDKDAMLLSYEWSPDSSQIAYVAWGGSHQPNGQHFTVSILDIAAGIVSVLAEYDDHTDRNFVSWSPDGHHLIYTRNNSFYVAEAISGKVTRIISSHNPDCPGSAGIVRLMWSPNGKWFYFIHRGEGIMSMWSCVGGLDGSIRYVARGYQSIPAWDNTGRYLYIIIVNLPSLAWDAPYDPRQRLLRFDVTTGQVKRLLSLEDTEADKNTRSVSAAPDGHTVETHTDIWPKGESFILLDPDSMTARKYTTDLEIPPVRYLDIGTAWSSDSQKIIFYAGRSNTPDGVSIQPYVAFYTLDINTGNTSSISGEHLMSDWAASPPLATP